MKKKLLALFTALSCFAVGISAFAAQSVTLTFEKQDFMGSRAVLSFYDKENRLLGSALSKLTETEGTYNAKAELPDDAASVKAFFPGHEALLPLPIPSPVPSATPGPDATQTPSATPAPTQKVIPPIYPKESDAIRAFAVVKDVSQTMNGANEIQYTIRALYQGREVTLNIEEDFKITTASDYYAHMTGQGASSLQEGDIIYMTAYPSGSLKSLNFLYRPIVGNPITSGENYGKNFEALFSVNGSVGGDASFGIWNYGKDYSGKYGYTFGLIQDKQNSSITLYNQSGKQEDALILPIEKDTIVYLCDVSNDYKTTIGSIADIQKTTLSRECYDSDGNVIQWEDETADYNYALLRTIDGIVTDIVVYQNYNN